jgi:hypothetical protein
MLPVPNWLLAFILIKLELFVAFSKLNNQLA